jgi:hypothetical protein
MRFTRSQARAQAAEDGQAALLQAVTTTHIDPYAYLDFLDSSSNTSDPPSPEPIVTRHAPIPAVAVPHVPSKTHKKTALPPTGIRGLPIPGVKRRQERYGTALRVQCVTLLDAGIPINIICSRWFVTKSSIHRWKRIAVSRGYNPEIDPRLLCTHVEDAHRPRRPSLQTYERTREMIAEICKDKEGRNLNCRRLGGKIGVSGSTACRMLKKNGF